MSRESSIALSVDGAGLVLAPGIGGAIAGWRWRGHELLRETPPDALLAGNVRLMASYPMVPYSNRIDAGRFAFDGETHALALNFGDHPHSIHGVGWQRPWEVAALIDRDHPPTADELGVLELSGFDRDAAEFVTGALAICLLEYEHYPLGEDREAWPFTFAAQQCLTLGRDFLALQMSVENRDDRPMPVGFGWHPFFAKTGAEIDLETSGVWHGDAERLPIRYEAPAPWRLVNWAPASALDLDHCFRRPAGGRLAVRWPEAGIGVDIAAGDIFRHVVVFCPPERDFLAIEPVTNMNDAFNELARGNADTGTIRLEPGDSTTGTVILRPFAFDPRSNAVSEPDTPTR